MIYDIFVGVDPSINSTGVFVLVYKDNELIEERSYIIKPDKLTKREKTAEEKYSDRFEYILYEKQVADKEADNTVSEIAKTRNFMSICYEVKQILMHYCKKYNNCVNIYACQEGISYGSVTRTKSIFDLAGLNFMLRNTFLSLNIGCNTELIIGTPGEIKKFASGNGNCVKDLMVELFKACHNGFDIPKIDDISDAYWMAKFAKKYKNL